MRDNMRLGKQLMTAVLIWGAVTLVAIAGHSQSSNAQTAKKTAKSSAANPVQTIELPQVPSDIPPGPHLDTYRKDCLICHGSRYVTMQPRFSQGVWEKEIKKMVDAYGATIPDADQKEILEYLVAVRGPEPGNAAK